MINKTPVVVNDTPGFVLNRILLPFILEAIRLVEQGVATSENIDTIMMLGMNLKVGPLKLADLIGLDVVKTSLDNLFNECKEAKYQPSILLNNMVRAKMLGKKTGKGFYNYSL
jgi:3-hydroxybutyryl-CoA dehydrogenase